MQKVTHWELMQNKETKQGNKTNKEILKQRRKNFEIISPST